MNESILANAAAHINKHLEDEDLKHSTLHDVVPVWPPSEDEYSRSVKAGEGTNTEVGWANNSKGGNPHLEGKCLFVADLNIGRRARKDTRADEVYSAGHTR